MSDNPPRFLRGLGDSMSFKQALTVLFGAAALSGLSVAAVNAYYDGNGTVNVDGNTIRADLLDGKVILGSDFSCVSGSRHGHISYDLADTTASVEMTNGSQVVYSGKIAIPDFAQAKKEVSVFCDTGGILYSRDSVLHPIS